jgi:hypothetical protein
MTIRPSRSYAIEILMQIVVLAIDFSPLCRNYSLQAIGHLPQLGVRSGSKINFSLSAIHYPLSSD